MAMCALDPGESSTGQIEVTRDERNARQVRRNEDGGDGEPTNEYDI